MVAADLGLESELIDENDLDVARPGVEFLHALVIRRLATGKVRQAFAMGDGPMIGVLHLADVVAAADGDFGAEGEKDRGFVA